METSKEDRLNGIGLEGSTLSQLGLDWEPQSVIAQYDFNGIKRKASNIHLIINGKTGEPLAAASSDWKPLGNRDFFSRSQKAFAKAGVSIERGGYSHGAKQSLRSGDRCVFLISEDVPQLAYNLFDDDKEVYHSRLVFYNHHHPGFGLGAKLYYTRLVCKNGAIASRVVKGNVFAHTEKGVEKHKAAISNLFGFERIIIQNKFEQEALAQTKIDDDDAIDFLVKNYGEKDKELKEQPTAIRTMVGLYHGDYSRINEDVDLGINEYTQNTAYGILQSVTAYYTHLKTYGSSDSRIRNQLFLNPAQSLQNSLIRAFVPRSHQEHIQQQIGVALRSM